MKLLLIVITLFLALQTMGQPLLKINRLLQHKELQALKNFVHNRHASNVDIQWESLRDIMPGYQEGVIKIEDNKPANDGTGGNTIDYYYINLLTAENTIFYYRFDSTKPEKGPDGSWTSRRMPINTYSDDKQYAGFENAFRQVYGDTLNHNMLFQTSVVYGSSCGFAGIDPDPMQQMNDLLISKDAPAIKKWLQSPNAEIQLYALWGYKVLIHQGYMPTPEESKLIAQVKLKQGSVSTCGGCTYIDRDFQEIVVEIESIPTEYLKPGPGKPYSVTSISSHYKAAGNSSPVNAVLLGGVILALIAVFFFLFRRHRASLKNKDTAVE
jgi:hypothetical protein